MKKLFVVLSLVLLMVSMTACSDANESSNINYNNYPDKVIANNASENVVVEEKKTDAVTEKNNVEIKDEVEGEIKQHKENDKVEKKIDDIDEPVIENIVTKSEDVSSITNKTLIATNSTMFNPNLVDRSINVRLAASYINGVILKPNEEFSFNRIVGERTAERGFKYADVFSGTTVVKGIGGGICQTSSTICGAVKQTNMKILEQNPHSMRVSYTTYENEAMINYGTSDFRFVNTNEFPILIAFSFETTSGGEVIKCDIYRLD